MAHYKRLPFGTSAAERLMTHHVVDPDSGCWRWKGTRDKHGYGRINVDGTTRPVHRVAYESFVGPIPDGLVIDHVLARGCVHHDCVNPAHLEAVTQRENTMRAPGPASSNAAKTGCPHGHPYSGDNLITKVDGSRWCRTCKKAADRKQYLKRKARSA